MKNDLVVDIHKNWLEKEIKEYKEDTSEKEMWQAYTNLHDKYIYLISFLKSINKKTPIKTIINKTKELDHIVNKMCIIKGIAGYDLGFKSNNQIKTSITKEKNSYELQRRKRNRNH